MTYLPRHQDFGANFPSVPPAKPSVVARIGIIRRLIDKFMESRQKEVDRQIDRFLAGRSSRHLTDGLEREISQLLLTSDWSVNRGPFRKRRFP
jgi:hypothetical protein